jgi:hypothetical protein
MEILINLYKNLTKIAKYYNNKRSRGLDLKEGDKV